MPGQGVQVHEVECVVLPGDDDSAFIDLGADFEPDAIVRKKDELGGVPDAKPLGVNGEQGCYFDICVFILLYSFLVQLYCLSLHPL